MMLPGIILATAAGVAGYLILRRIDKKWGREEFRA
jgi:hypothetical protein